MEHIVRKTSFRLTSGLTAVAAAVAAFVLLLSGCGYNVKVIREQGKTTTVYQPTEPTQSVDGNALYAGLMRESENGSTKTYLVINYFGRCRVEGLGKEALILQAYRRGRGRILNAELIAEAGFHETEDLGGRKCMELCRYKLSQGLRSCLYRADRVTVGMLGEKVWTRLHVFTPTDLRNFKRFIREDPSFRLEPEW